MRPPTPTATAGGAPEPGPGGAPLTVAAVAARLGVAASTLRTWDRRYGLGPSAHRAGSHRRYTPDDVARLQTMRALVQRGAAPADAARIAARSAPRAEDSDEDAPPGSGAMDPLSLAAAAVDSDDLRLRRMVARVCRQDGLIATWTELAEPAFGILERRVGADQPGRSPEDALAGAVLAAARDAGRPIDDRDAPHVVLLATDLDRLAAHVLASALSILGVAARVLRPTRGRDVTQALRAASPRELQGIAVIGRIAGLDVLCEDAQASRAHLFLVGPEAPEVAAPGAQWIRTLRGAVHEIAAALHEQA